GEVVRVVPARVLQVWRRRRFGHLARQVALVIIGIGPGGIVRQPVGGAGGHRLAVLLAAVAVGGVLGGAAGAGGGGGGQLAGGVVAERAVEVGEGRVGLPRPGHERPDVPRLLGQPAAVVVVVAQRVDGGGVPGAGRVGGPDQAFDLAEGVVGALVHGHAV